MAAHGDLLGAEDLPDRLRPPGARLDRGVVGDHHDLAPLHHTDAGDHADARRLAVVAVVGDQQADFQKERVGIEETGQPLAGRQLSVGVLALDLLRAAALTQRVLERLQLLRQAAHPRLLRRAHVSSDRFSANQLRMYSTASLVGVPGPNRRPTPIV